MCTGVTARTRWTFPPEPSCRGAAIKWTKAWPKDRAEWAGSAQKGTTGPAHCVQVQTVLPWEACASPAGDGHRLMQPSSRQHPRRGCRQCGRLWLRPLREAPRRAAAPRPQPGRRWRRRRWPRRRRRSGRRQPGAPPPQRGPPAGPPWQPACRPRWRHQGRDTASRQVEDGVGGKQGKQTAPGAGWKTSTRPARLGGHPRLWLRNRRAGARGRHDGPGGRGQKQACSQRRHLLGGQLAAGGRGRQAFTRPSHLAWKSAAQAVHTRRRLQDGAAGRSKPARRAGRGAGRGAQPGHLCAAAPPLSCRSNARNLADHAPCHCLPCPLAVAALRCPHAASLPPRAICSLGTKAICCRHSTHLRVVLQDVVGQGCGEGDPAEVGDEQLGGHCDGRVRQRGVQPC